MKMDIVYSHFMALVVIYGFNLDFEGKF